MSREAITVPARIISAPKNRIWFYKPEVFWYGWRTLLPWGRSHDEYSRETLILGWVWTGRAIVALWYCGDAECYEQTSTYLDWLEENPDG